MAQTPSIAKAFSSVTLEQDQHPCHLSLSVPRWLSGERICLPMQEMRVQSRGPADPLEEEMATCSRILAWRIPWTEEPGGPQSTGPQRAGQDWATEHVAVWPTSPEYSQEVAVSLKNYTLSWLLIFFSLKGNDQEANIIIGKIVTSYNR